MLGADAAVADRRAPELRARRDDPARCTASLDRDPVLVVPTLRRRRRASSASCARPPATAIGVLGVSIQDASTALRGRRPSDRHRAAAGRSRDAQRLCAVRLATASAKLRILRRSAASAGVRPGPRSAARRDAGRRHRSRPRSRPAPRRWTPTAPTCARSRRCYAAYAEARDALGYGDDHLAAARATAAAAARARTPGARPVFVYGFDDLTVEQLELLERRSPRAAEVTVAVAYEDRDALDRPGASPPGAAGARRRGSRGAGSSPTPPTPRAGRCSSSSAAFLRERRRSSRAATTGLALMESAGERGQAEQIGGEVARLLAGRSGARRDRDRAQVARPSRPPVRARAGGLRHPGRRGGQRARRPHGGRARAGRAAARRR